MRCFTLILALITSFSGGARVIGEEGRTHHTFRYLTYAGYPQVFKTMTFSPDSSQLAVSAARKVDFIDVNLGRVTGQYKLDAFSMAYTRDGGRIYMISEYRSALLDTLTGAEIQTKYKVTPGYVGIRLEKQSGKLLIRHIFEGGPVAALNTIEVGDELIGIAEGRNGTVRDVTGRDVPEAVDLMKGPAGAYLRLTTLPRGQFAKHNAQTHVVRRQPGTMVGNDMRFSELPSADTDENLAWCIADERHEFRSAASGSPIAQLVTIDINNIGICAISPDQKKFAVVARQKADPSQNAVEVFDIATQERLAYMWVPKGSYFDIAFADDNNRVLVATWDSVEIADTTENRFIGRLDLGWTPPPVEKDPDYSDPGAATVRAAFEDYETGGEEPQRAPRKLVSKLAVSSNNVVATADDDGHVKLWDLNSGQLLKELPNNPDEEIEAIAFSPNGQWLAYHIDGVLHVVDVADIEPLTTEQVELMRKKKNQPQVVLTQLQRQLIPGIETAQSEQTAPFVFRKGVKVEVRSRGRWYPAVIVRVDEAGRWQIHYEDSPEEWDESVTEQRMRPRNDQ